MWHWTKMGYLIFVNDARSAFTSFYSSDGLKWVIFITHGNVFPRRILETSYNPPYQPTIKGWKLLLQRIINK